MSACNACGSVFTTFEHQTRSADEAHTVVITCPACPVNANKLDSDTMPFPSFRGLVKPINRRSLQVDPSKSRSHGKVYVLSYDIPSTHEYHDMELDSDHIVQRVSLHKRSMSDTNSSRIAEVHYIVNGMFRGTYSSASSSVDMGIGFRLSSYDTYDVSNGANSLSLCKGKFHKVNIVNGYETLVQHMFDKNRRTLEVEIGNSMPTDRVVESITRQVYSAGIYPNNIRNYLGNDRVSRLSNLSARAWDTNVPPKSNHVFTSKPDGQRAWMVWSGHVWYVCHPRFTGSTGTWLWSSRIRHETDVLVADTEYVLSRGFILIDFLTHVNGTDAPVTRDLNWVLSQYNTLHQRTENVPFYVRQYFDTIEGATRYCDEVPYPCDGTVAVRNDSTEILKVKSVKSLELVVSEDRNLMTSDNAVVLKHPVTHTFCIGDIIEVRFTMNRDMKSINISDMFKRVDKLSANDSTAVSNIIQSSITSSTPDDNERRVALLWCNELRKSLQHKAMGANPTKSIILDVGTGNGQSLDAMLHNDSVSYIFLEPNERSCAALSRRLGVKRVFTDPREVVPMVRMLKTRSIQHVILNCTLQELVSHQKAYETILSEIKCITATFSAHYIVEELNQISADFDVPVYACTYVYDSAVNSTLVDTCGVSMKILDNTNAEVKWGGDKVYTEPLTYMRDYASIGVNMHASEYKQLPAASSTPGARSICDKIMVLTPY